MASDVSERLRREVAERAYHVCEYCLVHEDDTFWGCQVDLRAAGIRGWLMPLLSVAPALPL